MSFNVSYKSYFFKIRVTVCLIFKMTAYKYYCDCIDALSFYLNSKVR